MTLSDKLRKAIAATPVVLWERWPAVLLSQNIPKPLYGVAPRTVLGTKWWYATRKATYASTQFHCIACGVHKCLAKSRKWLEAHEVYDIDYVKGHMTYIKSVPLCHFCHNFIHDGRLLSLLQQGKLHHAKYAAVMQHGDSVLAEAGLERLTHTQRDQAVRDAILDGKMAEWGDWRLVVVGKEYPPLYSSMIEWKKAMGI